MATSLFETDRRLAGYAGMTASTASPASPPWLQPTASGLRSDFPLPERTGPSAAKLPPRPAAIRMDLRTFDLPADLVFAGEPWGWLGDALPMVTADSTIQPHQLAQLLRAGFFSPSDDAIRTATRPARPIRRGALHATRLLLSDDEACRTSIAEAVRRELLWLSPRPPVQKR